VERLALDCGELAVELFTVAAQRLEAHTGLSREQMMQLLLTLDPQAAGDERERRRIEAVQAVQAVGPFEIDLLGRQFEERKCARRR
jgi:hypothetical protein